MSALEYVSRATTLSQTTLNHVPPFYTSVTWRKMCRPYLGLIAHGDSRRGAEVNDKMLSQL